MVDSSSEGVEGGGDPKAPWGTSRLGEYSGVLASLKLPTPRGPPVVLRTYANNSMTKKWACAHFSNPKRWSLNSIYIQHICSTPIFAWVLVRIFAGFAEKVQAAPQNGQVAALVRPAAGDPYTPTPATLERSKARERHFRIPNTKLPCGNLALLLTTRSLARVP